jgi:hypothetical protein
LDEKLGLESEEWARWTQGEPHPGDGENSGYHHAHDVIILDGAAASEEVTPETFRTMIATHVSECDYAGPRAHDLDKSAEEWEKGNVETVSVKEVEGEIEESVASYAAAYLANEKVDLLEREPEYLAWAATMWATNTQKGIKSDSANHAIEADKCQHKHHDGERDFAHGEEKTRKQCRCAEAPYGPGCRRCDGRGFHIVCLGCLSPWQVEQEETLVEARRPDAPVAADGGAVPERETAEQEQEEELRDRWEDTRWAARVGGETAEREVSGRAEGRELEGRELELGGGAAYCAACGEEEPTGECSATAYKEESYGEYEVTRLGRSPGMLSSSYVYAKEGSSCPLPPEHFGEHTVVEGHDDAEKTVTTGSEEYRGDGHIPFEYESEPDGEAVEAGFERPPSWSAKAILRDGEEVPATGGTTEKIELNLPSAPERLVALVAGEYGVAACQACGQHCDSPKAVVEHECESRLYAGWLGGGGPPTPETGVDYAEFVEAIPERLLTESSSSDDLGGGESEPELGEEVKRYCANNSPTVPEVLGRFGMPPERAEEVAELVD